MTTSAPPAPRQRTKHPPPVLRVTFYDRFSSLLMTAVLGLLLAVIAIIVVLPLLRRSPPAGSHTALELVPGRFEQGAPEETLRVDSPEAPIPNAAAESEDVPQESVEETLETVIEHADRATRQVQASSSWVVQGSPGSAEGTGRGPLGETHNDGGGGEQRWYVLFHETASVDEYARQLAFFGIEPAALFMDRGELAYLSDLASNRPGVRVVTTWDDERLYMNWQGHGGRAADAALFQRAGVDVSGAVVLHFYPPETEQLLARLETAFAGRPADQIQRTYFVVVKQGNGYSFAVTRQHYNR